MTDDVTTAANADRVAVLTTKLERESRATRYLLVICTAASIAVTTFSMIKSYEYLPPMMLSHFMEHMPEVMMTYRAVENNLVSKQKDAASAPASATTDPASK